MRGGWAILIAVVALVLAWVFYPVGRYQVVMNPAGEFTTGAILLVDTRTGQTWRPDEGEWVKMKHRR